MGSEVHCRQAASQRATCPITHCIVLVVFLSTAACSRPEPVRETSVDLLKMFPYTENAFDPAVIDFTAPGAETYLVRGWSAPEPLANGQLAVHVNETMAQVRFNVSSDEPRHATLHCGLTGSGSDRVWRQSIRLQLNGRMLPPVAFGTGLNEHPLQLPRGALHVGENRLAFVPRRMPQASAESRDRQATLACDWIRLRPDDRDGVTVRLTARDGTQALALPAAATATYFVRVPEAAWLGFDLARAGPSVNGTLSVSVGVEGDPVDEVWHGGSGKTDAHIDLSRCANRVIRLELTARDGDVELRRPRLVGHGDAIPAAPNAPYDRAARPNVLVYLIDTLRADHLGSYGYQRPTSPHIDALAQDALLFAHTSAQASWTRPATASLLTGLYPYTHGALTLQDSLRPDVITLAETLHAQGYTTAAYVTNINVGGKFGFDRGFDSFNYLAEDEERPALHVGSDVVNESAFTWLREHAGRPFFLYLHVTDPHAPYLPPPGFAERFRDPALVWTLEGRKRPERAMADHAELMTQENLHYLESLYDGEIAFVDENFGKLVEYLKQQGLYDNTIILVTADHGEEFFDHGGFEHGYSLYQEQLTVPLIIRLPGAPHSVGRVDCLARQIDVMPTLLEILGIAVPPAVEGHSLWHRLQGLCGNEESFAQTSLAPRREQMALTSNGWKVLQRSNTHDEKNELFDLKNDPHEQHAIEPKSSLVAAYGRQALRQWSAGAAPTVKRRPAEATPDAATMERLRVLGYTED